MIENQDKYYIGLYGKLREIADKDWAVFCELIGYHNMQDAMICILLARGYSLEKIAIKLGMTKRQVQLRHESKCNCGLKEKIKPFE